MKNYVCQQINKFDTWRKQRPVLSFWLVFTICFFIIFLIIGTAFLRNNMKTFLDVGDGPDQLYPALYYYGNSIFDRRIFKCFRFFNIPVVFLAFNSQSWLLLLQTSSRFYKKRKCSYCYSLRSGINFRRICCYVFIVIISCYKKNRY